MESHAERRSSGFTLIELLAAVAIIAILISLVVIGLGALRHKSWRANTHASLSQHVRVFHSYAADYSDRLPQLSSPTDMNFSLMGGGIKTNEFIGYFWTTQHWHIALADHYYGGRYKGRDFQTRSTLKGAGMTNLAYSASLMANPHFWDEMTRIGPSQWGSVELADIDTPDAKAMLFDIVELMGYDQEWSHLGDPNWPPPGWSSEPGKANWEQLDPRGPGVPISSVGLADGSAKDVRRKHLSQPYPTGEGDFPGSMHPWGIPMHHTRKGAKGRDVN